MGTVMIVTALNGDPVRVREHPATASATVARLRCGTEVVAGDDINGWRPVEFGDMDGYMMSKFLKKTDENDVTHLTAGDYNRLCEACAQIEASLKTIKKIVGVS